MWSVKIDYSFAIKNVSSSKSKIRTKVTIKSNYFLSFFYIYLKRWKREGERQKGMWQIWEGSIKTSQKTFSMLHHILSNLFTTNLIGLTNNNEQTEKWKKKSINFAFNGQLTDLSAIVSSKMKLYETICNIISLCWLLLLLRLLLSFAFLTEIMVWEFPRLSFT